MTTEERFTRIESVLVRLADRQEQRKVTLDTLAESHIKLVESLARLAEAQAITTIRPQ